MRRAMRRARALLLGMAEFRALVTSAFPDPAGNYTDEDEWYDRGRELAHRITRRRFEP